MSGFHCIENCTVSFGFCNEPPQLHNGIWKTTSNGYMHGTSITAMCNDDHELVGGDNVLKCGRGANSSSVDFDWHGNTPSCQERIFGKKNQGIRPRKFIVMIILEIKIVMMHNEYSTMNKSILYTILSIQIYIVKS